MVAADARARGHAAWRRTAARSDWRLPPAGVWAPGGCLLQGSRCAGAPMWDSKGLRPPACCSAPRRAFAAARLLHHEPGGQGRLGASNAPPRRPQRARARARERMRSAPRFSARPAAPGGRGGLRSDLHRLLKAAAPAYSEWLGVRSPWRCAELHQSATQPSARPCPRDQPPRLCRRHPSPVTQSPVTRPAAHPARPPLPAPPPPPRPPAPAALRTPPPWLRRRPGPSPPSLPGRTRRWKCPASRVGI